MKSDDCHIKFRFVHNTIINNITTLVSVDLSNGQSEAIRFFTAKKLNSEILHSVIINSKAQIQVRN